MPAFVSLIAPGFVEDADKIRLAIDLTRITFPFLMFVSLSSFFAAILNSHNKFAAASAAPIILNLILIGILFFGKYLNDDLISYFYRIVNDIKMPSLNWKLNNDSIDVILDYNGNYSVSIWSAKNDEGRDFRLWQEGELWKKSSVKKSIDNTYKILLNNESTGYEAIMMEFILDPESDFPFIISTGPFVLPDSYPYEKYEPLK